MSWRIGVDIGGTLTDVARVNETDGRISIAKVPTTPRDFGEALVQALTIALREHQVEVAEVSLLSHATTVVANAILEDKGAR
jgi:N-methylhydantoinase A